VTVENTEDGTMKVQAWDPQTGVDLQQTFGREGAEAIVLTI
jgi:hypothetical protein